MGKKPLLGLAAVCLGLTLSGCKDCNGGGGGGQASRKHDQVPVARHTKPSDTTEVSDSQNRQRSVPNTTQPSPYNFPADNYDVATTKPAGAKPVVVPRDGVRPVMPHTAADVVPTSKFETIADTKAPMHEVTGQKPISKADAAAAGVDTTDMVDVPAETAKKPAVAPVKDPVTAPVVTPKEPIELPVSVEPKPAVKPAASPMEAIDGIPPPPPLGSPKVAPAKEVKNAPESVVIPVMPDLAPPSADMKPVTPPVAPAKPVVVETKTVPVPDVPESVPPAPPGDVKSGPDLQPPSAPPAPVPPPPMPGM